MKILILEDEIATANDLEYLLKKLDSSNIILDIIDSVEDGISWLENNESPDLIFSDIQLADGLSFDLFEKVKLECPVIFCTAFDEYAIKAFENHGVAYILKPFDEEKLQKSMQQYQNFANIFGEEKITIKEIVKEIRVHEQAFRNNFLIHYREKMIPLDVQDIASFYAENGMTYLMTYKNHKFNIQYTLEQLEQMLDPKLFFRANRKFILSFQSIEAVEPYFARKLYVHTKVSLPDKVIVSKQKSTPFLRWMEENH
ncbi:LytTR family DNA-binding domain-containing protein [Fulvivirga maritima]|uniref:LytR/AlgR family response regulator transcription factor n=1 Tax=Fulvivirga maritima TaxID=2904247 RepID=UPI001F4004E3|nr:LytTR family DNA-binding domain-containing protein [Fulvivirga maritima]UII25664.1 LytTR family DNA-binding domain-containing protein [Fulvivirga maritima]